MLDQARTDYNREGLWLRIGMMVLVLICIAGVGAALYSELRVAIDAVAKTKYPGHRIVPAGTMPVGIFASHFLAWTMKESPYPVALNNISESSGFLWLGPVALSV